MKRMELQITLTFAIMLIVGIMINGFHSVISMNSNFFNSKVVIHGFLMAVFYLGYIWINTRRYQLLITLGVCICVLILMLTVLSPEEVTVTFSSWNWYTTILCLYFIGAYRIANYQSKKILEHNE